MFYSINLKTRCIVLVTKKLYQKTQQEVSLLGFGCMRFPVIDGDDNRIDYEKSVEMIDFAYKSGVNYFDTAYGYHGGESEKFVGVALKRYPRESFFLASKMPPWFVKEEADIEKIFNNQLERCQVDYFDFYLEHSLNDENYDKLEKYNTYEFLTQKKKEGKIRNLGFSFHGSLECLERILSDHEWDFVQLQYNYLDAETGSAQKEYEMIKKYNLPLIVMEPVRGGALANLCEEANALLKKAEPDKSIASWAIRFAASNESVLTVLSGMSTSEQVEDNIRTMSDFKPLTEDENTLLSEAAKIFKEYFSIPCTKCRYCTKDCPQGIDIPEMLSIWGRYRLEKNAGDFLKRYNNVEKNQRADRCISCRLCESFCPQSIQITDLMNKIKDLYIELSANK